MNVELRGDLYFKEVFGENDKCLAQLRHQQYPGLRFSEEDREASEYENPINFFNLNIELVPPRGRFTGAEFDLRIVIEDADPAGGIEVGPETTSADAVVSVGTFYDANDMLRLRDTADDGWIGDCVLPWGPLAAVDPASEYSARLEVAYDHEATLDKLGAAAIETKRERTEATIEEVYDIQGKDVETLPS